MMHRRTDPACIEYRAPRPGSWRDRRSRGRSCRECMGRRPGPVGAFYEAAVAAAETAAVGLAYDVEPVDSATALAASWRDDEGAEFVAPVEHPAAPDAPDYGTRPAWVDELHATYAARERRRVEDRTPLDDAVDAAVKALESPRVVAAPPVQGELGDGLVGAAAAVGRGPVVGGRRTGKRYAQRVELVAHLLWDVELIIAGTIGLRSDRDELPPSYRERARLVLDGLDRIDGA